MKRIYIAGPYSADNVMEVLHNIRKGIDMSYKVFALGYAPFSPWLDYHFVLSDKGYKLKIQDFYDYSLAWLKVSDAMLVLPNYESSKGTLKEIEYAESLGIPVYYSLKELQCRITKDVAGS